MQWNSPASAQIWLARLGSAVIFFLLVGSVTYWLQHWPVPQALAPVSSAETTDSCPGCTDRQAIARVLGASAAPAALAAPAPGLELTGVIANANGSGVALITQTGHPPRSVRVGGTVQDGLVLQSVTSRKAMLAPDDKAAVTEILELPHPAGK